MARQWTRKERREHIASRFYEKKEKTLAILGIIAVFVVLLAAISYTVRIGADPFLIGMLVVALLVMIPTSVFIFDIFCHESE